MAEIIEMQSEELNIDERLDGIIDNANKALEILKGLPSYSELKAELEKEKHWGNERSKEASELYDERQECIADAQKYTEEKIYNLKEAADALYNAGYSEGKEIGYDEGFKAGLKDGTNHAEGTDRLRARIKELEEMYDKAVAKKSKPSTPMYLKEIGSVFKSIFKNDHRAEDENFHKAFKFGDCLIACDGYRVIRTAEKLPDDIPVGENEVWAEKMNGFLFNKTMDDLEFKSYELPPLSVLKERENNAKANKPKGGKLMYVIKTDKGLVGFNYKYLTDGMKATHSSEVRISGLKSPATMQDGIEQNTVYMLLPINIQNNTTITDEGLYWI